MSIRITIRTESDDRIRYWYDETVTVVWRGWQGTQNFSGHGVVPREVVKRGKEAIRLFVREKAREGVARQKKETTEHKKKYQALNIPITTSFKKQTLHGRIVYSKKEEGFVIRLENPGKGESYWDYGEGFGAAMAGIRKFKKGSLELTPEALANAREKLKWLYRTSLPNYINETGTIE